MRIFSAEVNEAFNQKAHNEPHFLGGHGTHLSPPLFDRLSLVAMGHSEAMEAATTTQHDYRGISSNAGWVNFVATDDDATTRPKKVYHDQNTKDAQNPKRQKTGH